MTWPGADCGAGGEVHYLDIERWPSTLYTQSLGVVSTCMAVCDLEMKC